MTALGPVSVMAVMTVVAMMFVVPAYLTEITPNQLAAKTPDPGVPMWSVAIACAVAFLTMTAIDVATACPT